MSDALREQLAHFLNWGEAHVGFDKAVAGIPPGKRGARAPGFEHSAWQLVEHMRIAQEDILDFCVNPDYVHDRKWPDDYWPGSPEPPDAEAWQKSVDAVAASREKMKALAREVKDLTAPVPTGNAKQTYLRAILLVADHASYHVGALVALRRALGIWK